MDHSVHNKLVSFIWSIAEQTIVCAMSMCAVNIVM